MKTTLKNITLAILWTLLPVVVIAELVHVVNQHDIAMMKAYSGK